MKKVNITLTFDDDKLDALEFSLRKEHSSVQARMDDALKQLYEQTVPEAVREYLDSKAVPAPKPKRTAKSAAPKTPNMPTVKIWSVTSRSQIRRKMRICVEPMPFPDAAALPMSLL